MKTRRDFFSQFIGHLGVLRDEFKGIEMISLNRLKELPETIIEKIEPEFFPEENWYLQDAVFHIPEHKFSKKINFELNNIELLTLDYFKNNTSLKQTAIEISEQLQISFDGVYKTVTNLFFKLASLRICHPREVYHIDEILKAHQQNGGT